MPHREEVEGQPAILLPKAKEMVDAANEQFAIHRDRRGGKALAHVVLREQFHPASLTLTTVSTPSSAALSVVLVPALCRRV